MRSAIEAALLGLGLVLNMGEAAIEAVFFIIALWFVSVPVIVVPSIFAGASYGGQIGMNTALVLGLVTWLLVFIAALLTKLFDPEEIEWAS
jgi:hypothetical protein